MTTTDHTAKIPDYAYPPSHAGAECECDSNPAIGMNHGPEEPWSYELHFPFCADCMDRAASADLTEEGEWLKQDRIDRGFYNR